MAVEYCKRILLFRSTTINLEFTAFLYFQVVAGKAWCPKYAREKKSILKNEFFQKIDEENKKLYEYLSQESGAKVTNVIDVFDIYDTLFIEERFKFKLPQWTNKVYPEPLKRLGSFSFMIPCFTREMARLKMG